MKNAVRWIFAAGFAAMCAPAQVVVNQGGVLNVASYAFQGLPNSAIAQGSLFTVFGLNMGPAVGVQVSSFPLLTNFHGTEVSVVVSGVTVRCLVIYTSSKQVTALLPSSTPIGKGTLSAVYNGSPSGTTAIEVTAASFGIFTANQSGGGVGIITDVGYQQNSYTRAFNAGDAAIVWGTGVGAVKGDEAGGALPGDLTGVPVDVIVGATKAKVIYRGRSGCCAGLDQIVFTVPAGVTGYNVPVAVKVGNVISNFVAMPIAASGRTCSDPSGLSSGQLDLLAQKGSVSIGYVVLSRSVSTTPALPPPLGTGVATTSTTDSGFGVFGKVDYSNFVLSGNLLNTMTFGACSVTVFRGTSLPSAVGQLKWTALDVGPALNVTGPRGMKTLTPFAALAGFYFGDLGSDTAGQPPLYLGAGSYWISNASGGKDVGPFNVNMQVPQPLNWTNQSGISTVTRANGQPITWSGADPNGTVEITGFSMTGADMTSLVGAIFVCTAKASDGQFTVPAEVLLALPPSVQFAGISGFPTGSLSVGSTTDPIPLNASGIDYGFLASSVSHAASVNYQ